MMDQMRYPSSFAFSSSGNPNVYPYVESGEPQGNRSRLDSASSESSRGSGKPPRRRSHRPRGCRGGSNRRRNNADGTKKPSIKDKDNKAGDLGSNMTILSKHPNHKQVMPIKKGVQEYTILSRQAQPLLERERSTFSSTSTAQMTEYSSSQGGDENPIYPSDFSAIQPSFSDSSSEFGTDPIAQDLNIYPSDSYSSIGSEGNIISQSQILPPLPSNAFHDEYIPSGPNPYALKPSTHDKNNNNNNNNNSNNMMFSRENFSQFPEPSKFVGGYATPMKNLAPLSIYYNSYPLQYHSNNIAIENGLNMKDYNTMGPPPPRPKLFSGTANNANYVTTSNGSIGVTCSSENDYRAERLEIQRQIVEGGSLFVTSPRSFLMGKRNGNMAAAF